MIPNAPKCSPIVHAGRIVNRDAGRLQTKTRRPDRHAANPHYTPDRFGNLDRPTEYPASGQQGHRADTGDVPAPVLVCRWTFIRA